MSDGRPGLGDDFPSSTQYPVIIISGELGVVKGPLGKVELKLDDFRRLIEDFNFMEQVSLEIGVEPKQLWLQLRRVNYPALTPKSVLTSNLPWRDKLQLLAEKDGFALPELVSIAVGEGLLSSDDLDKRGPFEALRRLRAVEKATLLYKYVRDAQLMDFVRVDYGEKYDLYVYDGGLLVEAKSIIDGLGNLAMGYKLYSRDVSDELEAKIAFNLAHVYEPEDLDPPRFLPCENCYIDLDSLSAHLYDPRFKPGATPLFRRRYRLPVTVSPGLLEEMRRGKVDLDFFKDKCPLFLGMITRFFNNEKEKLLDCLGLLLYPYQPKQGGIVFIVGDENTGKTTLKEVLMDIFGPSASSIPLSTLISDRFALLGLKGIRLVISSEKETEVIRDIETIKRYSGDETVSARKMFTQKIVSFKFTAKLWYLFNETPEFARMDSALLDRIVLIYAQNPLSEDEIDKEFKRKLMNERNWIFHFLLWCYWQLKQRSFRVRDDMTKEEKLEILERSSNPIWKFISECCVEGGDAEIEGQKLYNCYVRWCSLHQKTPKSMQAFYSTLKRKYNLPKRQRKTYVRGVTIDPSKARDLLGETTLDDYAR